MAVSLSVYLSHIWNILLWFWYNLFSCICSRKYWDSKIFIRVG